MKRKPYPSDLTDEQWALIEPLLPRANRRRPGRPRKTDLREVVNALFYHAREGCTWRALPHDLPPWKTVYNYFQCGTGTAPGKSSSTPSARWRVSRPGGRRRPAPPLWT